MDNTVELRDAVLQLLARGLQHCFVVRAYGVAVGETGRIDRFLTKSIGRVGQGHGCGTANASAALGCIDHLAGDGGDVLLELLKISKEQFVGKEVRSVRAVNAA